MRRLLFRLEVAVVALLVVIGAASTVWYAVTSIEEML